MSDGQVLVPFQVLLSSQTGHRKVKNGWGPGSPASAPFFTRSPYEAGGLQEDGALHPWKAKPSQPGPWAGSPTGRGLD